MARAWLLLSAAQALSTSAAVLPHARTLWPTARREPALLMPSRLHSLRGGATATPAQSKKAQPKDPALTLKLASYVIAWAVVPTLLRLAYAASTLPAPAPEPALTMLQRIGWAAAPTALQATPLPFPQRWQVELAAAWVANNLAVRVPGRYDGQTAMAAEKPTAATANLFTPSGWAFIIWAPIFMGEFLMMLYLTNVPAPSAVGAAIARGWVSAAVAQSAWCAAFRPSVCGPAALWLPALLLATTGGCLGVAHRALRATRHGPLANALVRWPIVLHFGWICAAALVNLNNWLARIGAPLALKEATAYASVVAAVGVATYVTVTTRDPVFAAVIAWALAAVVSDGAKNARGLVDDAVLDRVRLAARLGCAAAVLLVCTQI